MARRERYNRRTRLPQKRDKVIRQSMVNHESRLPTLDELRATTTGIEETYQHFDADFGFGSRPDLTDDWND